METLGRACPRLELPIAAAIHVHHDRRGSLTPPELLTEGLETRDQTTASKCGHWRLVSNIDLRSSQPGGSETRAERETRAQRKTRAERPSNRSPRSFPSRRIRLAEPVGLADQEPGEREWKGKW
jgi:hypothetical protein